MDQESIPAKSRLPPEVMNHIRRIAVRAVEVDGSKPAEVARVLGFCRASIYN